MSYLTRTQRRAGAEVQLLRADAGADFVAVVGRGVDLAAVWPPLAATSRDGGELGNAGVAGVVGPVPMSIGRSASSELTRLVSPTPLLCQSRTSSSRCAKLEVAMSE